MRWILALGMLPAFAQSPGIIEGVVADPTGAVIPGALADLAQAEIGPPIELIRTDENGRFQFSAVKPGSCYVRFRADGFYIRRRGPFVITSGNRIDAGTTQLNVSAAAIGCCNCEKSPPQLLVEPTPTGTFWGRVIAARMDLDGKAVLTPSSGEPIQIRIEDDGTFMFKALSPGRYSLRITVPTYAPFEIPRIELKPATAVKVDGWIALTDCPKGAECKPTRTVQKERKSDLNVICL